MKLTRHGVLGIAWAVVMSASGAQAQNLPLDLQAVTLEQVNEAGFCPGGVLVDWAFQDHAAISVRAG